MQDEILHLIQRHRTLLAKKVVAEDELKQLTQDIKSIEEVHLPLYMGDRKISELKLGDGTKIMLTNSVFTSIASSRKNEAFEWLTNNGHGDVIKEEIRTAVHPQTLNSLGKELIAEGIRLPEELFNQYVRQHVKIKHGVPV